MVFPFSSSVSMRSHLFISICWCQSIDNGCTIMVGKWGEHTAAQKRRESNSINGIPFLFVSLFVLALNFDIFLPLFYFSSIFTLCFFPFFLVHFKPKTPIRNVVRFSRSCKMKWNENLVFVCAESFFLVLFAKKKRTECRFFFHFVKQNRLTNEHWHWHRCSWWHTHTHSYNIEQTPDHLLKRNMAHSQQMEIAWDIVLCYFLGEFQP